MLKDNARDTPGVPPQGRPAKGESLRDKIGPAVLGFFLTGVIGTMVGTWFQQRGWAWQNRVMQVEKDTGRALDSLQAVSSLLNKRWSATLEMVHALEDAGAKDESKAAKAGFLDVNKEWELDYANVESGVKFNVDRPFGVDSKSTPDAVWRLPCDAFPFDAEADGSVSPNSAHAIRTVIDHCHGLVKTDIDTLSKTPHDPAAGRKIADSFFRLDHIYHINDVLRCVILERAVAMRRSLDTELGWGSFFQIGPQTYAIPAAERDCVAPYRAWSEKTPRKPQ